MILPRDVCKGNQSTFEQVVHKYFTYLELVLTDHDLMDKPHLIYNVHDIGLQTKHRLSTVQSDSDTISAITSITTVLGCGNASGDQLPPCFIYKGPYMQQDLLAGCSPGATGLVTESGSTNSFTLLKYLEDHFLKFVQRPSAEQPVVLILDGHRADVSVFVQDWAKQHNIVLVILPAHSSHVLQPLDVGCFGLMQSLYDSKCQKFRQSSPNTRITHYNVCQLACPAYTSSLSCHNLIEGFNKTGVYPLDRQKIVSSQFPVEPSLSEHTPHVPASQEYTMAEKYIIDVDTGVDDAQALMLALSRPDVDVIGITCVSGNVLIDQVCINTLKVLKVCDRLDVPVYKGSGVPLVTNGLTATHYHGMDGLGDADLDIDVSMDQIQDENAVNALIRLVNEYPGEITLVALAPLTNIALAIRQDPEFGKKLKKVVIMGGNTQGRGNSTLCAEFNFASDPDAAYVVLECMKVPILVAPWEINLTSATGQSWDWFDKWVETNTPKGKFNKAIIKVAVHKQRVVTKRPIYRSCDLNAMAMVVDPSVVTATEDVYATVELNGTHTRGMMVVDWRGSLGKQPNITLINAINTKKTKVLFEDMVK